MLNATIEMFMSEYFLIKAILGKYLTNGKELFVALSKICLIPETEATKLYDLAENGTAKEITTDKDFMQHQRMQKYSKLIGSERQGNAEWEEVARIKGNAILIAMEHNLILDADASRNVVYAYLSSAATSGTVIAMRIMGILQCEGIFLEKNEKAGLKNLSKVADWNDGLSVLALLHYRKDNRAYDMARLRQILEDTPFANLYEVAKKKYKISADINVGEVKLLYKAFGSGILKSDEYDSKYARVLNSKALCFKDKEKAVFSQNKEQLSIIGALPLKLSPENITALNVDSVQKVTLEREAETAAVTRALKNSDLRELPSYRPLCICSESRYVLNMYAKAIAFDNKAAHAETIDVAELTECDLEPTPNNIFVRSIDEDKDNRFLLFFSGEISERKMEAAKSILQSGKRAKFHLNSPSVTLNLGAVLPVCFCDKRNMQLLEPYCDILEPAAITADELACAIREILSSKERLYGIGEIKVNGDISEVFSGYDIDAAEKIIDVAVRAHREKGATITLSRDVLQEYKKNNDKPRIGFGGYANGRNQ